jgi:phage gp36-like protein
MSYSTFTSILTVLPGMPQTSSAAGYSNACVRIAKHLTRASALVDAAISKRYSVPLTDSCPVIDAITDDIAAYYSYRSFYSQDNHNKSEYFKDLLDVAMQTLNDIRTGEINIVDSSGNVIDERTSGGSTFVTSNITDYQPFFDVDDSKHWKFDDDLLDSINDKR